MREGDLILSVNQKRVGSIDEFEAEILKTPDLLVLNLMRNGEAFAISMKTREGAFPNALR